MLWEWCVTIQREHTNYEGSRGPIKRKGQRAQVLDASWDVYNQTLKQESRVVAHTCNPGT